MNINTFVVSIRPTDCIKDNERLKKKLASEFLHLFEGETKTINAPQ